LSYHTHCRGNHLAFHNWYFCNRCIKEHFHRKSYKFHVFVESPCHILDNLHFPYQRDYFGKFHFIFSFILLDIQSYSLFLYLEFTKQCQDPKHWSVPSSISFSDVFDLAFLYQLMVLIESMSGTQIKY